MATTFHGEPGTAFVVPTPAARVNGRKSVIAGNIALVTGAGGANIGRAVARELARRGARRVGLIDLPKKREGIKETAALIEQEHLSGNGHIPCECTIFEGDVRDERFMLSVFDGMTDHDIPRVAILAAGITKSQRTVQFDKESGTFVRFPLKEFQRIMEINAIAPYAWLSELLLRIANRRHAEQKGRWSPEEGVQGACIITGSVMWRGDDGLAAYGGSKAALIGIAGSLAKECRFHGFQTNVLNFGFIDTELVRESIADPEVIKGICKRSNTGAMMAPDVAGHRICNVLETPEESTVVDFPNGWY